MTVRRFYTYVHKKYFTLENLYRQATSTQTQRARDVTDRGLYNLWFFHGLCTWGVK